MMGYSIKVDHSKFEKTASVIDDYTRKMEVKMGSANDAISTMLGSWIGDDANAFNSKWNTVNDADSTYGRMKKSLESYSSFLKSAGKKYKTAQADAINRANRLPKW